MFLTYCLYFLPNFFMKKMFSDVNNSININKMNNHLSPRIIDHNKQTTTYNVRNPGPGLGQAQKDMFIANL